MMPEATPDLNDPLEAWEHDIGFAGEIGDMKPIAIAHSVDQPPHDHFR
jgi:hypothetical protein